MEDFKPSKEGRYVYRDRFGKNKLAYVYRDTWQRVHAVAMDGSGYIDMDEVKWLYEAPRGAC